ncbi:metallophosphoesterase, partial [candidate division WOR-3 bacterium]|nr:metallophosphoesterase [candidate division WOR-3 bacterium]
VNFVFSGHKHMPWIWNLNNTYFINSGTSATRKLKGMGYPSYNIINIDNKKVKISEINLITEESKTSLETTISQED